MAHSDWIGTAKKLIEICRDAEHGYTQAARNLAPGELKRYFEQQSSIRAKFAEELRTELSRSINTNVHGSVLAAVHRGWLDLLSAFPGSEKSVLAAVRQGEARAMAAYEAALAEPMPPQLEQLARRQLDNIRNVYSKLEKWQFPHAA